MKWNISNQSRRNVMSIYRREEMTDNNLMLMKYEEIEEKPINEENL